jgi:NTP pyrophosphatase (non-canonical NTP hydrolase)
MRTLAGFVVWTGQRWKAQQDPNAKFIMAMGVVNEAAEVSDELKKSLRTWCPKPLNVEKLKEEMGDCLSYWAAICAEYNLDPVEIMNLNIAKLEQRERDAARNA